MNEIPVLLLTGYLGAGKTTLLNRILRNEQGYKFAVIVNDIGEVNIDATLIEREGFIDATTADDSLVALQNGCICCSLKMDLVKQLQDICAMGQFDYIVIEASGVCEPMPIAQTICSLPMMPELAQGDGPMPVVDCICTVVDALRMRDEFGDGADLMGDSAEEQDIANLIIQQLEFCNIVLLNKASMVSDAEREQITDVIKHIQPKAAVIACDHAEVALDRLVGTGMFNFNKVATSAAWIQEIEKPHHEHEHEEHHHDHEHHHEHEHGEGCTCGCHDHEHHHEHGEGCTCGCHDHDHGHEHGHGHGHKHSHLHHSVQTYVYYSRKAMDISRFDEFVARRWPKNVIRAKGLCFFADEDQICYLFEQAGKQFELKNCGQWYATMPEEELKAFLERNPKLFDEWDPEVGDRVQKLVFIGRQLDKGAIKAELDKCLTASTTISSSGAQG